MADFHSRYRQLDFNIFLLEKLHVYIDIVWISTVNFRTEYSIVDLIKITKVDVFSPVKKDG